MPGSKGRRPGLLLFGKQSKTQRVKVSHFRLVLRVFSEKVRGHEYSRDTLLYTRRLHTTEPSTKAY